MARLLCISRCLAWERLNGSLLCLFGGGAFDTVSCLAKRHEVVSLIVVGDVSYMFVASAESLEQLS